MAPKKKPDEVAAGAVPAEELAGEFPEVNLPVTPPLPPMEARSAEELPAGEGWLFEPKWDGFRCLAFRDGETVALQSKAGQPLGRYFPELEAALCELPARAFALDGEIVIVQDGALAFDALLQRIHPAESRIRKLARETPARFHAFDLLVDAKRKSLLDRPLAERRERLEGFFEGWAPPLEGAGAELSPATRDRSLAERWMASLGGAGLDGVIAKRLEAPYQPGERESMVKVKRLRTADCVVGGFRWSKDGEGEAVGSLLLGLHDEGGRLDHVGFSSSFSNEQRRELAGILEPHVGPPGFTGKAPGGPSRWSRGRSTEWVPLRPALVCEVRYDHFTGGRFRHGTRFLRWRPDKPAERCTFEQVRPRPASLSALGLGG